MKRIQVAMTVAILLFGTSICAMGTPTPLGPFFAKAFTAIGATSQVEPLLSSVYNYNDTFTGTIMSSVWQMSSGDYLYLYQATNDGPSALELLGVAPFHGIKEVGCITSDAPSGYAAGGLNPVELPTGSGNYLVSYDEAAGANVTFTYLGYFGGSVPAGQHTSVLYLVSSNAPVAGSVYAMDGGVGSSTGWTASVPEPCSLIVLGTGVVMLLRRRYRA